MPKSCYICQKTARRGKSAARRGMAKKKGGAGNKILRVTLRKFLPNLQKVKILINGRPERVFVCAKCLKAKKVQKAP